MSSRSNIGVYDLLEAIEPTGYLHSEVFGVLEKLATGFFSFLLLLFVLLLWRRIRPLRRRAKEMDRLVDGLKKTVPELPLEDKKRWETEVWPKFPEWLRLPADEFEEQCWEDKNGVFRNAHQADLYFNDTNLDPGHEGFGGAVPGLLTAIGILGTFVGITIGLGQIESLGGGDGLDVSNSELQIDALLGEIANLVSSLGVSFRTSIWGLLLSMLSTWRLTAAEGAFEKARLRLVTWLNEALERGTEHYLLQDLDTVQTEQLDVLRRLAGIGEDQKGEIQSLAEQLQVAFEEVILGKDENGTRVNGLAQLITQTQSDGVDLMVDDFLDRMDKSFGSKFDDLGTSIDTMVGANAKYGESMSGIVAQLSGLSGQQAEAAEKMTDAVSEATGAIGEIRETMGALTTSASQIQSAAAQVGGVLEGQSDLVENQTALSEQLTQTLRSQTESWATQQEAYQALVGKFDGLAGALSALTTWHDQVKDELSAQLEGWQEAVSTQAGLTETIARERSGVNVMLSQLGEATASLAGLRGGLEALAQQLQTDLSHLQGTQRLGEERLTQATSELAHAGASMRESWQEYVETARALSQGLPDVTQLLEGVRQSVSVQKRVVSAGGEVAMQLQSVAAAQTKIRESFDAIARAGDATRAAMEPAATAIAEGAASLKGSVDGLEAMRGTTARLATSLETAATRLTEADQRSRQQWTTVTEGVERTTRALDAGMTEYSNRVNANLKGALTNFDEELRKAVALIGHAISGLSESVEQIQQMTDSRSPDER
jgi:chromosome segregation ATPase